MNKLLDNFLLVSFQPTERSAEYLLPVDGVNCLFLLFLYLLLLNNKLINHVIIYATIIIIIIFIREIKTNYFIAP
jgi:hypothetical protein